MQIIKCTVTVIPTVIPVQIRSLFFDSVIADQVLGFFNALRSAGVPIQLACDSCAFRTTEMQAAIPADNPNGERSRGKAHMRRVWHLT
jgi:hypothetical protein